MIMHDAYLFCVDMDTLFTIDLSKQRTCLKNSSIISRNIITLCILMVGAILNNIRLKYMIHTDYVAMETLLTMELINQQNCLKLHGYRS